MGVLAQLLPWRTDIHSPCGRIQFTAQGTSYKLWV